MPNITAKTSSNTFYQARCKASTHNEQLSSREGAADIMSIDRGRLYRIESGIANPYPEEVHLMADLYNSPELRNFYCRNCCPLGENIPAISSDPLPCLGVKAFLSTKRISESIEELLEIVQDGKVEEDESKEFLKIIDLLNELNQITQSLNVWKERQRIVPTQDLTKQS